MHTRAIGQKAESDAEATLLGTYPPQTRIWYRNWRCGSRWELDRILLEPDPVRGGYTAVFVEVRYRGRASAGIYSATESLGLAKRRHLATAIRVFLAQFQRQPESDVVVQGVRVDFWYGSVDGWGLLRGLDLV